jgi:glutathione synthase/RimK-type ligase-like ATP-grasp enzyme
MKLYPYNEGSTSAKALATALGIKRIKHEGKVLDIKNQIVINWGCSYMKRPIVPKQILNVPANVSLATNKLKSFNALKGTVTIPDFTESREEAAKWLAEGVTVVERHTLTGHSGEGVNIVNGNRELQQAPLYVKYIPKKDEYRVHVFREKVFFVQQKKRKQEIPDDKINWQVRNHQNGFIYANQDVALPQKALDQAVASIKALGLDFGAVDIIYNQKSDMYYVLEVNTACGLTGTTLDKYVEVFKEFV